MLTCHACTLGTILRNALLLLVISFTNIAEARNFYFSTANGDDSRTSTQAQNSATPWRTINKLNSYFNSLLPGDSILIKRGEVFYGSILVSKSGTSSQNIILSSYGTGDKPIITAVQTFSVRTNTGAGVYALSATCLTIYYDSGQLSYPP